MEQQLDRIRDQRLKDKVVTPEQAASFIENGMTLGLSGFTRAGDVKAVPFALVNRVNEDENFKVNVYTGASLGSDVDKLFAEAGILGKRLPFQADPTMRRGINQGDFLFVDQHLSHTAELIRADVMEVDVAILEAVAISEDGMVIPTTSIGNSMAFAQNAKSIIIEINTAQSTELEGLHDLYEPGKQGERKPIPLTKPDDRIGTIGIPVDVDKIKGIVFTNQLDSPSTIVPPDEETVVMAQHLIELLRKEVQSGRLTENLAPLQSGIGSVANAVLHGMLDSEFENLEVYSEVLQDAVFDLIDAGKVKFASCCSITLSEGKMQQVFSNFEKYREKLMMRPQEISNHPEIIRRLGLISINTALELDIYGNVNSTHVLGTKMMNGIGGSGDFARNARLAIFVTKSIAKGGNISSIVPFVSHVDHTEHDVDVIVTEQGYADLRGLAPRERVQLIIENCAHPMYREQLRAYYQEALQRGGQTPHVLEKALSWHTSFASKGTMLEKSAETVQV
ncbi:MULTISPECIES: acetyl-CoA hydrolase/transferase family protein [unclassified Mesobacillus]|uniref:acetyl-CoA hydrolase/transferase family protein n=1 Tax=unclassified Mesobacillus TaxID=2675270 RepID=UPI0020408C89|nr:MULTISPECIES: acetyl-CoA hydrolase/transferase family protein [unclassified Mesobacillus]MCM3125820.1 acetyl-CoA hydrolase/transferase family protein [Mesobacillus sp. MER 33]MCM3235841.1 acetyl-CoA hydrolase/transferase family protein [Mesobacillus sp. MER 48]